MIDPSTTSVSSGFAPELAIEAEGLCKWYGRKQVVRNLSLRVKSGTVFGMLGPNGAGKSTTIRMLLGLTDPDAGTRKILGVDDPRVVASSLGYLPEERGLYPSMKAVEAVAFMGAIRGLPLSEGRVRAKEILREYCIPPDLRIRDLSKGMAQLVQIAGTIVHRPRLLVLDEPFSGLDPLNQERVEALITDYAVDGATILLSTHVIPYVERLCDGIAIIDDGSVKFDGSLEVARSRLPIEVRVGFDECGLNIIGAQLPSGAICEDGLWIFDCADRDLGSILTGAIRAGASINCLKIERPSLQDVFRSVLTQGLSIGE